MAIDSVELNAANSNEAIEFVEENVDNEAKSIEIVKNSTGSGYKCTAKGLPTG